MGSARQFVAAVAPGVIVANFAGHPRVCTFAVIGCTCVSDLLGKPVGRHARLSEAEACAQRVIARKPTSVIGFMRAAGVGSRA